jgi:hypothetical protein
MLAESAYRSYSFSYGDALRVRYETELGAVQIALLESGGKVRKTFPQKSPHPPYRRGDTFTLGPELDNSGLFQGLPAFGPWIVEVEECSVSDQPLGSSDGRNLDRIWIADVSGRLRGTGTPGAQEGSPADVDHPVSYSYSEKAKDGRTLRFGARSLWLPEPVSPYDVGDSFSPVPGGASIEVTDVSISDQVIGKKPDGSLVRLWKITVTGDEESSIGTATVNYTFSRELAEEGYILVHGTMTKTSATITPPAMPALGDTFAVPYIGNVTCVKIDGSQSVPPSGPPSWSMSAEGALATVPDNLTRDGEESFDYSPNGVVTRDVAGNMVVMLRSSSPRKTRSVVIYNDSASLLTAQGNLYQGMIATGERIAREDIKVNGVKIAEFYRHEISAEY